MTTETMTPGDAMATEQPEQPVQPETPAADTVPKKKAGRLRRLAMRVLDRVVDGSLARSSVLGSCLDALRSIATAIHALGLEVAKLSANVAVLAHNQRVLLHRIREMEVVEADIARRLRAGALDTSMPDIKPDDAGAVDPDVVKARSKPN